MTGFGDIIGHEQIIEHFRSALKNHQVSHAYILNGENGSGKNMLAKAFAKALVCEAGYGDSCNMWIGRAHVCVGRAISLTAAITRM